MRRIVKRLTIYFVFIAVCSQYSFCKEKDISNLENTPVDAEKLLQDEKLLQNEKTREQGIKQLSSLAKFANKKLQDTKFNTGCEALVILARISRNACGYELITDAPFKAIGADTRKTSNNPFKDIAKQLSRFGEYSIVGDWQYGKERSGAGNPRLLPFLELAYYKAIDKENSENLKQALKMLTYAESRTEGIDQVETLCQWGELLRELKEFKRSKTYLDNAMEYGNKWFKPKAISASGESETIPGTDKWNTLKKRIETLLFLLDFDLLEADYGNAYATYVKMRAFYEKKDWSHAYPLSVELKDKYPESVYGEAGRLYWCRMLLENEKAGEFGNKSLPSGVKELEKFISEKPYGLYRGEAWMELGSHFLEYKWDEKQSATYYNKALEWFRNVRDQKNLVDLYALPEKVRTIAAPKGVLSSLNGWRQIEYRKPDIKEIINQETAPEWYVSENEKTCLFMVGFFLFMDGKYDEARECFEQVKVIDSNVAKLVGLNWPNVYWRLISACNIKRMIFPIEDKKCLKGKNRLRVALAELTYICERFSEARDLYQNIINDPKSSDAEKALAYIGMGKALDMMPYDHSKKPRETKETIIGYYRNAIRLAKNTSIESMAHFYMGHLYLTVGWDGRYEKGLACYEKYLEQRPDGEFAKESQFRQMLIYINLGMADKEKCKKSTGP